ESSSGVLFSPQMWLFDYVHTLFCFMFMTPFLLRWYAKPAFRRTTPEILVIAFAFALLLIAAIFYFTIRVDALWGIELRYFLLVPFFIIALRLRPRFVSLALLIAGLAVIAGFARVGAGELTPLAML